MAFKGIIYERPGQGMRVRPHGGRDQDVGGYVFDQMSQGDVSGLVDDLMQPGVPVASSSRGPMLSAAPGRMQVASRPMEMADRTTGEDFRRGYSAGNVSADELRASLGFNDAGAKRARFQIRETQDRQLADRASRRQSGTALALKRMELQADLMRPVPLGGSGGVAQLQRDGTLRVEYPPAPQAQRRTGVVDKAVVDLDTGTPIYQAPERSEILQDPRGGVMRVRPSGGPVETLVEPKDTKTAPSIRPMPEVGHGVFEYRDTEGKTTIKDFREKPERYDAQYAMSLRMMNPSAYEAYMQRMAQQELQGGKVPASGEQAKRGPATHRRALGGGKYEFRDANGVTWQE